MKWIKVTEKMPEDFENVLLYSLMSIELGFYSGSEFHAVYHGECLAPITHWLPLPNPPLGG